MPDNLPVTAGPPCFAGNVLRLFVALPSERIRRFALELKVPPDGKPVSAVQAARTAGYPQSTARRHASRLQKRPDVRAFSEAVDADTVERSGYTRERFMADCEKAKAFALETKCAPAFVRAVEIQGRSCGHIVDRVDARIAVGTFAINVIGLDDARQGNNMPALPGTTGVRAGG